MKTCLTLAILLICLTGCFSSDEVSRVPAPDGKADAVLIESNGGATTSFYYNVFITSPGESTRHGQKVANFYGATRSESAYGVNIKWFSSSELVLTYLKAHDARLLKSEIAMANRNIQVSLKSGITDTTAPSGGMLYNLKLEKARK